MAEQTKKDNRGIISRNNNKTKPTHPDLTGSITIEGKEWRLAVWQNKSADGKEYFSIISSPPLTPEQQNQYRQNNGESPAENPIPVKNNSIDNNSSSNTPIDMDLNLSDEIDDILKAGDDENPFN